MGETSQRLPLISHLYWSEKHAVKGAASGVRGAAAIGAPWYYLLELLDEGRNFPKVRSANPSKTGVIAFPYHSSLTVRVSDYHAEYAEVLRDCEGGPVTVVLHPVDAADRDIARKYRSLGHRVISFSMRKDDPLFLLRQHHSFALHHRVVSNRLCTAVWYGVSQGLEARLYGPPGAIEDSNRGLDPSSYDPYRVEFPHLYGNPSPEAWRREAARQLGRESIRCRAELAELLGLSGSRRLLLPAVLAGVGLRRRVLRTGRLFSQER